ncbi:sensor histidine kinase [Hymenobacter sp. BT770]|uniref:sensor histidine kinase n=1 Tax=Hymenobacter sp. BT770 TaxID=2886942 RepID=UPI001D0FD191|nr:sensor histidine kinase [Hymenobacter sp. BT770]MCC3153580.1 sensor histidine kinase [Hymenobacter sp. BT770]MDO3415816.1 sensor histidine kinase [Hymenobacter sp. BT770]
MDAPAEVTFGTLLLGGIGLMLLLAAAFVGFVVTYQQRLMRQQLRLRGAEAAHQHHLLTAVIAAQEAERERIGRDLHDDVASSIAMAKMLVDQLSTAPNAADAPEMLALAREVLGSAVEDVRTVSHNLYPDQLARVGLVPALSHLAELCRRTDALAVDFDAHYPHPLPLVKELALYRICQELVHNTLKHASGAAHLRIQLRQQDGNLVLSVEDDGCGFATSPPPDGTAARGMGLRSIGVRVEMLGAELEQHSAPGLGTRTRIKLAHP